MATRFPLLVRGVRTLGRAGLVLPLLRLHLAYLGGGIGSVARLLPRIPRTLLPHVLRTYGATIGRGTRFKDGLRIDNAEGDQDATGDFSNLRIGRRCYIGLEVFFDLPDRIVLEDEVVLSAGVRILTHADCGARVMRRWYPRIRAPVQVGQGSWIGVNAVILAGVNVGRCCVVGAGAVVTRDVPDYTVVAGAPARIIRRLEEAPEAETRVPR